jgi:hypothetical protein
MVVERGCTSSRGRNVKKVCEWKEVVRARVCMDRVVLFSIDYISCGPSISSLLAGMQLVSYPILFDRSPHPNLSKVRKSTYLLPVL